APKTTRLKANLLVFIGTLRRLLGIPTYQARVLPIGHSTMCAKWRIGACEGARSRPPRSGSSLERPCDQRHSHLRLAHRSIERALVAAGDDQAEPDDRPCVDQPRR